jgi:hypothetical protein
MYLAAILMAVLPVLSGVEGAQDEAPVRGVLERHCKECHGGGKSKGEFRLEQLSGDAAGERWVKVQEQLKSGAMPPKAKPRPSEEEQRVVFDWIGKREAARRAKEGRVVLRRLNRQEYTNTVGDLMGVETDFRELLALDGTAEGFDNVAAALHLSSFALERYLEAARAALDIGIVNRPAPAVTRKRTSFKTNHMVRANTDGYFRILEDDTVVHFVSGNGTALHHPDFWPAERGYYRFRICASGFQSQGKAVTFQVQSSTTGIIGYFDAPADTPTVFEYVARAEARSGMSIHTYGLGNEATKVPGKAKEYKGKGLAIHWVEVEGPLYESWPPAGHRAIFGDLLQAKVKDRLEVVSKDPIPDAERILRSFTRRAFRRSVTDDDVRPYVNLVKARLEAKDSFEAAVRVALSAVMTSTQFLFLNEKPGKLDDFALASRLSYFLWSTMPDEELLALAEKGELSRRDVLRGQVERMIRSPRAAAFTKNFCGQWLGLRSIDATEPNYYVYPEWDAMLKASMVKETELFFREVLEKDLSLANFADSDFTFANGRLARHYGLSGVEGNWEFRKVALPPGSHRGGVLTMGSVLKVTANGTTTSPITRGIWVLEGLLGTPPPKPPAGVQPLEPDIRGARTLKEQFAKHRNDPSCASCHARIDPPGFALENYDVIGGWREYYRQANWTKGVKEVPGQRYLRAADVDTDGRTIEDLKKALLADKDQLARSLVRKIATYATGGAPEASDQSEIEEIVGRIRGKDYGLKSLIHELVQSRMFREK